MNGWTDENVALLKKLWADNLSAGEIAKQMRGFSRNAIIGKANRLGLSGRAKPSQPQRIVYKAPPVPRAPHQNNGLSFKGARPPVQPLVTGPGHSPGSKPPTPVEMPDAPPGSYAAPLTELGAHQCRWPLGRMLDPPGLFCGEPLDEDRDHTLPPYCAEHLMRSRPRDGAKKKTSAAELARSLRRFA